MLRRFHDDRRGVAAVEFALIAPVMIMLYMGLAELTLGMMAERRASHAASVVADLVAQSSQLNAGQVTDIFKVSDAIMSPFPASALKLRVTSVKADSEGVPKVVWSQGSGLSALTSGSSATGIPTGLLIAGESIVVADVSYTYTSPLHQALPDTLTFSDTFYLKPRKSNEVTFNAG